MRIEKGQISPVQFMCAVTCFIQASALLTSFFVSISKQDSWMPVLFGGTVGCLLILVYLALMKRFPEYNLFQINNLVFGTFVGKLFSVLYLIFFLTLATLNLNDLGSFVKKSFMPNTPFIILIGVFMLVCALAVHYGLEVVTRYSVSLVILSFVIIIISIIFTSNLMDFDNFLPVFDQPLMAYIQPVHIISTIPFGEIVVFLMIIPNIRRKKQSVKKHFLFGFLMGIITMLVVVLRDTAVLGNAEGIFALPSFETLRMVSLTQTLSRMEILFALIFVLLLFFKVSFLYYVSVLALTELFGFKSYKSFILIIGALITVYATFIYPSSLAHLKSARQITPLFWMLPEYILPVLTLVTAAIRGVGRKRSKQKILVTAEGQ